MRWMVVLILVAVLLAAWLLRLHAGVDPGPDPAADPADANPEARLREADGAGPTLASKGRAKPAPHERGWPSHRGPPPTPRMATLRGLVIDALTEEPVPRVRVFERHFALDENRQPVVAQETETFTDTEGRFRLEVAHHGFSHWRSMHFEKQGYAPIRHIVRAHTKRQATGDGDLIQLARVVPVAGRVVDGRGRPMAGAQVHYYRIASPGLPRPASVQADRDGYFRIEAYPLLQTSPISAVRPHLEAYHPDALERAISTNVITATPRQRLELGIVMRMGIDIAGLVEDEQGRVLPDALVEIWDGSPHRRGARTDAAGRFTLRSVEPGRTRVRVLHVARRQRGVLELTVAHETHDVEVRTRSWAAPTTEPVEILGMTLVDATPALREALFLPDHVGVVVLDPGSRVHAIGLPALRAGDGISHVAGADCGSIRAFLGHIEDHLRYHKDRPTIRLPIACEFLHPTYGGSHSATLVLAAEDIEQLRK